MPADQDFDSRAINLRAFAYYSRLRRLDEFVRRNRDAPLSLSDAARITCLSDTYFSEFFHRKVGVRFRDWYAHTRVHHAMRLMAEHNDTITQVGYAAGFRDLRTFQRVFKRHTGLTPREFRAKVRPS